MAFRFDFPMEGAAVPPPAQAPSAAALAAAPSAAALAAALPTLLALLPLPSPGALGAFPTAPLPGLDLVHYQVPSADAVSGVAAVDVVPGVYEGGAKIWECTRDLLGLAREGAGVALAGARVLDLGCGAGLLGVHALLCGAASVTFQDLNQPVLTEVCARNLAANRCAGAAATLLAGDWGAMLAAVAQGSEGGGSSPAAQHLRPGFDVILSAETLYRPEAYAVLCPLLLRLLRGPGAQALFATKRFYFGAGLGGGTHLFTAACQRAGLVATTVRAFEDGHSNVRDIVRVTRAQGDGGEAAPET